MIIYNVNRILLAAAAEQHLLVFAVRLLVRVHIRLFSLPEHVTNTAADISDRLILIDQKPASKMHILLIC